MQCSSPLRRTTTTQLARLTALSEVLDFVCGFRCRRHNQRALVQQVMNGRIAYAACCDDLLDAIDESLKRVRLSELRSFHEPVSVHTA